ncbi:MAG: hypothetical protein MJ145_00320 [Clostridia bacterium]|nr:hypothetical protein [Clostridia bacterium]
MKKLLVLILSILMIFAFTGCGESDLGGRLYENMGESNLEEVGGAWVIFGALKAENVQVDTSFVKTFKIPKDAKPLDIARYAIVLKTAGAKEDSYGFEKELNDYEAFRNEGHLAQGQGMIAANMWGFKLEREGDYLKDIMDGLDSADAINLSKALEALSFYDTPEVNEAKDWIIAKLSEEFSGDYGSLPADAEVIIALCQVGIDPSSDERFSVNGVNLIDTLKSYEVEGLYMKEITDTSYDQHASEMALLAFTAYDQYVLTGKGLFVK